jgi:hypothetical protein
MPHLDAEDAANEETTTETTDAPEVSDADLESVVGGIGPRPSAD